MQGKVAIVMPYYNDKELLAKAVMGILGQNYYDWELFLVDDGSVPGNRAWDILPSNITSRVRVVQKPNGGVCSARNAALNIIRLEKRHDYVAYCDADDVWDETYLVQQQALLDENTDFVYSAVTCKFVDGSPAYPFGIPFFEEWPGLETLFKCNFIFISGVMHKIKCLDVGDFDPTLNSIEDWDYWCRIAKAGYNVKRNRYAHFTYTVKANGNGGRSNATIYNAFFKKHDLLNNTDSQA
jgi:glycosyltransferase involved in cell wall biosynthesis